MLLQVLELQKFMGLTYWQKESRYSFPPLLFVLCLKFMFSVTLHLFCQEKDKLEVYPFSLLIGNIGSTDIPLFPHVSVSNAYLYQIPLGYSYSMSLLFFFFFFFFLSSDMSGIRPRCSPDMVITSPPNSER